LVVFTTLVSAQNSTTNITAASTFYLEKTETQFSVNIADDSNDVFIYFTSPAYSWVGMGFGERMEGSLMLIMYPNAEGENVTLSPRIGSKAAEPSYNSSIDINILPGTKISDSMLVLHARCTNCRPYLDPKTTTQPMLYAFGNGQNVLSSSPSANLKRHVRYGTFTMDMKTATGPGGVPAKSSASNGIGSAGPMIKDHNRASRAHAVLGCVALFVLWPLNVLLAGFLKNIKIHIGISAVIMICLIISYVLGGLTSTEYNRSKAFTTPHQILAFLTLLPLLLTSLLPPLSKLAPRLRNFHTHLTSTSFLMLVLTGGLGLSLSAQSRPIILLYTAAALAVFIAVVVLQSCIRRRGSRYRRHHPLQRSRYADDADQEGDRVVMLGKMEESRSASAASLGRPPSYERFGGAYGGGGGGGGAGNDGGSAEGQRLGYGGGTMPGPQYLLNMHPGVPVQVSRM
ncbi:CBD9-like protein, partial [Decorospora gaudefroyi]